jgi:hypothetical protein
MNVSDGLLLPFIGNDLRRRRGSRNHLKGH